jgi:hypothetical protein
MPGLKPRPKPSHYGGSLLSLYLARPDETPGEEMKLPVQERSGPGQLAARAQLPVTLDLTTTVASYESLLRGCDN